jgi:hypothetical protein
MIHLGILTSYNRLTHLLKNLQNNKYLQVHFYIKIFMILTIINVMLIKTLKNTSKMTLKHGVENIQNETWCFLSFKVRETWN